MNQTKAFLPAFKELNVRDGSGTLVVATLNTIDLDGDVTLAGFFGRQTVALVPAHDHTHVPLGKGRLYEVGNEALVDFKFNLKVAPARDWFEAIRFDYENPPALQQYSYGYRVLAGGSRRGEFNGRPVQFLQPLADGRPGVLVHEVSPVMIGAGIGTRTTLLNGSSDTGKSHAEELASIYLQHVAREHGIETPQETIRNIARRHGIRT